MMYNVSNNLIQKLWALYKLSTNKQNKLECEAVWRWYRQKSRDYLHSNTVKSSAVRILLYVCDACDCMQESQEFIVIFKNFMEYLL